MPTYGDDQELILKAQAGDQDAKETVLKNNLNLVRSVVNRFTNRGYEWDDLFQIGCIGLIKAVERFDRKFNVRFSTYAVPMIIGELKRFIRDDNPVKVSRPVKELAYRIHKTQEKLQGSLGREPTINELAAELTVESSDIITALEAVQPVTSIYDQTYFYDGAPMQRLDQIRQDDDQEYTNVDKLALKEILMRLPSRERLIIHLRYFEDKTQSEIASIVGLSQVQVSRLEKQAVKLIRTYLQA